MPRSASSEISGPSEQLEMFASPSSLTADVEADGVSQGEETLGGVGSYVNMDAIVR